MRVFILTIAALLVGACSKSEPAPQAAGASSAASPAATSAAVTATGSACPATGLWAPCSVLYHLERAGLNPRVDSSGTPEFKDLGGSVTMYKVGQMAELELHVYADSTARRAAAAKLNRADFVDGEAEQTMRREKTLIESVNVIGLLTSLNSHQRERVSDAITAGPPQPAGPVKLPPAKTP